MSATQRLLRHGCLLPFVVATALMVLSTFARAQYAAQSQCSSETIVYEDSGSDDGYSDALDQTVCLSYDNQAGITGYVETDNDYASDFYGEYGIDNMWAWGVGAGAHLSGFDASGNSYDLADSEAQSGTDASGSQSVTTSVGPLQQQYLNYELDGTYSACISGENYWACYWQSDPYVGSNVGLSVQLNLALPSTVAVATSNSSVQSGQPVTFTATVTSGATGTVYFRDSYNYIGVSTISGNTASLIINSLAVGNHSIVAEYSGDATYERSTSGAISQIVIPAGFIYSYTITPANGPSGYDPNGNIVSYSDSVNGSWTFNSGNGYDSLNRLSAATQTPISGPAQSFCWTYDSFGNRTAQATSNLPFINPVGASTCQFAPGSTALLNLWATYSVNGSGASNNKIFSTNLGIYRPDDAGNITSDGVNGYSYDAEGRLCAVAAPQYSGGVILTQYIYDAEGSRIGKGTNSNQYAGCDTSGATFTPTEGYIIGASGEQLTETDGQGHWKHTNVYAAGNLIATYDQDPTSGTQPLHFQISDWLGTRRVQTDYVGNTEETCHSFPFGDQLTCIPTTVATADDATEQHFTAKERDPESGNDYMFARYYNSTTGRFLSPDWSAKEEPVPYAKLDNPQSLNLFNYVGNNPLNKIDPDGHASFQSNYPMQALCRPGMAACMKAADTRLKAQAVAWGVFATAAGVSELAILGRGVLTAATSWCLFNCGSFEQAASSRLSEAEVDTGERLAAQAGLHLQESAHIGEEFVDKAGKTYDAMGQPKAYANWDADVFEKSIANHLNKAVDYVAIDLKGASKEQIGTITKYVGGLAKAAQDRIKYVK